MGDIPPQCERIARLKYRYSHTRAGIVPAADKLDTGPLARCCEVMVIDAHFFKIGRHLPCSIFQVPLNSIENTPKQRLSDHIHSLGYSGGRDKL